MSSCALCADSFDAGDSGIYEDTDETKLYDTNSSFCHTQFGAAFLRSSKAQKSSKLMIARISISHPVAGASIETYSRSVEVYYSEFYNTSESSEIFMSDNIFLSSSIQYWIKHKFSELLFRCP